MARLYDDWLNAFIEHTKHGEAPRRMYFWVGVSAIAGALRRRVWINQAFFKWYPNFYIVLVAPPGIVSKSTTASVAMSLLRRVPGIKFGPDVVTWPALVSAFAENAETFLYGGFHHPMSALTLESSEFGNLLNPQDKQMVDLLVSLWDGKQGIFEKRTKHSGNDAIENPWINLVACTTPSWIAGNFPEYMVGGGFTSRCIFVYAEEKDHYNAYPGMSVPVTFEESEMRLVQDLEHIATNIVGEYTLSSQALEWGEWWYKHHYENRPENLDDDRFGGYIARKQTHIHKLAMVMQAAKGDSMVIDLDSLTTANMMVTDLEPDMQKVFGKIGRSEMSVQVERLLYYARKRGKAHYMELYRYMHAAFPSMKEYEDVLAGCVRAGLVRVVQINGEMVVEAISLEQLEKAGQSLPTAIPPSKAGMP